MLPAGPSQASDPCGVSPEAFQRGPFFYECFAGSAGLTNAVRALGVIAEADEASDGGTNFLDIDAVDELKKKLRAKQLDGHRVALHLAPPCSTFSRARDRGRRTRLRSRDHPEGLPGKRLQVKEANAIADTAWDLARWAADQGMLVSLENPRSSYLWEFVERSGDSGEGWHDVTLSQCRFGAPYQKPTILRCWNWRPEKLEKTCVLRDGTFTCGRSQQDGHETLEFGKSSTAAAAAYPEGLCEAMAVEIAAALGADTAPGALEHVRLARHGRVRRHALRGVDEDSAREKKRAEDEACLAGMRNPSALVSAWPKLWRVMAEVKEVLARAWDDLPELQGLTSLCGDEPTRRAPSEDTLTELRRRLGAALGVGADRVDAHHAASPWRYELVRACQRAVDDPDLALADWLQHGAPMGITRDIEVGGLFPTVAPDAELSVEELDGLERIKANHPSFEATFESDTPPGVELMVSYVNAGFGLPRAVGSPFRRHSAAKVLGPPFAHCLPKGTRTSQGKLHVDVSHASAAVGREVHPAPMGTVSKLKDDGSWKHRPIQETKRTRKGTLTSTFSVLGCSFSLP